MGILAAALALLTLGATHKPPPAGNAGRIRLLIVTGGHDFERQPFLDVFRAMPDVTFRQVEHPNAHALLKPDAAKQYDVLVLYDLWEPITDEARADFISLLKRGKGLVALHHSLASYQKWPEYERIVGGRYFLANYTESGAPVPPSTYQHGVTFRVHVVDSGNPITRGLRDFQIVDETYGAFRVASGVKPLLTTEEATSGRTIAWEHRYLRSRVAYIALGHDHTAYENPSYRALIHQAIQWAAGRRR